MVKRAVSLYLDVDVVERHKQARTNISDVCNTFLKNYLDSDEKEEVDYKNEAEVLKVKIAEIESKILAKSQRKKKDVEIEKEKNIELTVEKLKQLNNQKLAGSIIAIDEYKAVFDSALIEFGLTRAELADKVF